MIPSIHPKRPLRYATVCSGIGAPEHAWRHLGWQPVFAAEIEKFPAAVFKLRHPGIPNLGDITKFHDWPERCRCQASETGAHREFNLRGLRLQIYVCIHCGGISIDLLAGGTPCQSFSVAGLRKGLADPRGNLALIFLAIVDRYRPRWVVWENVPGVHSSWTDVAPLAPSSATESAATKARRLAYDLGFDTGAANEFGDFEEVAQSNDCDCFLAALEQLRYGIATTILDAQYRGLAQRRERVFVVGHIGGQWQRAAAVLFDAVSLSGNPPPRREAGQGTAPTISARTQGGGGLGTDADCDGAAIAVGINGEEIGFALRANPSASGDKGDGGVNTTMVAEISPTIRSNPRNNSNPNTNGEMLVAHALRAEVFDASEDGTGRGTPLVPEISPTVDTRVGRSGESTFAQSGGLIPEVAPTLRAGGNKTGGDRPPGSDVDTVETLIPEPRSGHSRR